MSWYVLTSTYVVNVPTEIQSLQVDLDQYESTCFVAYSNQTVTITSFDTPHYNFTGKLFTQGSYNDYDYNFANESAAQTASYQIPPTVTPRPIYYLFFNLGPEQTYNFTVTPSRTQVVHLTVDAISRLKYPTDPTSYYYVNIPPNLPLAMYFIPEHTPILLSFGKGDKWDLNPLISMIKATNSTPIAYNKGSDLDGGDYYVRIDSLCSGNCSDITYRFIRGIALAPVNGAFDFIVPAINDSFYFEQYVPKISDVSISSTSLNRFNIYAKNNTVPTETSYDFVARDSTSIVINPDDGMRKMKYLIKSSALETSLARGNIVTQEITVHPFADNRDIVCVSTSRAYYSITVPPNSTLAFTVYMQDSTIDNALLVTIDRGNYGANTFFKSHVVHPQLIYKNVTSQGGTFIIIVTNTCQYCVYCIVPNALGRGPYLTPEGKLIAIIIASIVGGFVLLVGVITVILCLLVQCNVIRLKRTPSKLELKKKMEEVESSFNDTGYYSSANNEKAPSGNIEELQKPLLINEVS
jgi:hypothetical protein